MLPIRIFALMAWCNFGAAVITPPSGQHSPQRALQGSYASSHKPAADLGNFAEPGFYKPGSRALSQIQQQTRAALGVSYGRSTSIVKSSRNTSGVRASSSRSWLRCQYNWSRPGHFHLASAFWLRGRYAEGWKELKQQWGVQSQSVSEAQKTRILMQLTRHAARTLDNLGVNWFIARGAAIGQLRSASPIPWDTDIDILVRVSDRPRLWEFVKDLPEAASWKGDGLGGAVAAVEKVEQGSLIAMFVKKNEAGHVDKALWIDMATEVPVDFCFDCRNDINETVPTRKAIFGTEEVNMPVDVWDPLILSNEGVDLDRKRISMVLANSHGWNCEQYSNCKEAMPKKFAEVRWNDFEALMGPAFFSLDEGGDAMCAMPPDLSQCEVSRKGQSDSVNVKPCLP